MNTNQHAHSDLIDCVDPRVIRTYFKLSPQRLHAWRKRGIPYAYRAEFAKVATIHGQSIPDDFLAPPPLRAK